MGAAKAKRVIRSLSLLHLFRQETAVLLVFHRTTALIFQMTLFLESVSEWALFRNKVCKVLRKPDIFNLFMFSFIRLDLNTDILTLNRTFELQLGHKGYTLLDFLFSAAWEHQMWVWMAITRYLLPWMLHPQILHIKKIFLHIKAFWKDSIKAFCGSGRSCMLSDN